MRHESDIETILKQVDPWPEEDRVALAYRILRDMRINYLKPVPRTTLKDSIGVAAGKSPAPDDETVRQWIDEHRARKFG